MKDSTIPSYYLKEKDIIIDVPARIKTLHHLSTFLLRNFIEGNDFKYGMKGKVEIVEYIVSKQSGYTRYSAIPNIATLVINCYEIYNFNTQRPLSNRDRDQLEFMFKKEFETALTRADAELKTSKSFDSMEG